MEKTHDAIAGALVLGLRTGGRIEESAGKSKFRTQAFLGRAFLIRYVDLDDLLV